MTLEQILQPLGSTQFLDQFCTNYKLMCPAGAIFIDGSRAFFVMILTDASGYFIFIIYGLLLYHLLQS